MIDVSSAYGRDVGVQKVWKLEPEVDKTKRFAHIPLEIYPSDLEVSAEQKKLASSGDQHAINQINLKQSLAADIKEGMARPKKTVELWKNEKGEEVYLYPAFVSRKVLYVKGHGRVYCPSEWEADVPESYWKNGGPVLVHGMAIIMYTVNPENGEVDDKVRLKTPKILSDGTVIDFNYQIIHNDITDSVHVNWKRKINQYPMISSDYLLTGVKPKGNSAKPGWAIDNTPDCLWRSKGPLFMQQVIAESRRIWGKDCKTVEEKVCKKMANRAQFCQAIGSNSGPPPSTAENAQTMDQILGG